MSLRRPTGRLVAERYRLLDELGRGGMGMVWRARDERLLRHVAVKEVRLPEAIPADERDAARARALREARAAARLSHPSAVTIFDVQQEEGRAYLVMELVEAPSLADVVRESGALDHAAAARVGLDVLDALDAAHAAGIVHRDVKPANVMVPPEGPAKLADFGIASLKDDPKITQTGLILGSPSYMAPEQAEGRGGGPSSDLWALGATLYYAVEGQPPFDEGQPIPTLAAVMHDQPRAASSSGALASPIAKLLSKDPADRPSHVETRRMLEAASEPGRVPVAVSEPPGTDVLPQPAETRLPPHTRPNADEDLPAEPQPSPHPRPAARAAALVALLLITAAALMWWSGRDDASEVTTAGRGDGAAGSEERSSGRGSNSSGPEGEGESSAGNAPGDWTSYEEPTTGHAIAYPTGWDVIPNPIGDGSSTDFRDPASGAYLRLDWTDDPGPSALGAWQDQEATFAANHARYERVALEPTTYRGYDAAVWEFTWEESGKTLHAIDLGFVVDDDYGYALNFVAPEDRWADFQDEFSTFKQTFSPPS